MVVLKRLSAAERDGDRILAVIRGSAVNQDGRTSGLTVPNGPSQQTVIRQALANAGVQPPEVGYVEAHGTATALGDPIELQALGAVFGSGRDPGQPLWIGSVKTNLGHLEAAAGIAGLIKVVLALGHQALPPHLHFNEPTPHVAWDRLPVAVPRQLQAWPAGAKRRLAGVSSFGFSGTNAHVVVEEAPPPAVVAAECDRPVHLLCLSARCPEALAEQARRFATHLRAGDSTRFADIAYTAHVGRAHAAHRLAIVADSCEQAAERLADWLDRRAPAAANVLPPEVAFVFTETAHSVTGLGHQLYETQPTFRRTLEHGDRLVQDRLGWSLLQFLYPRADAPVDPRAARIEPARIEPARIALVAVQAALAQLWQSWGIEPAWVIGQGDWGVRGGDGSGGPGPGCGHPPGRRRSRGRPAPARRAARRFVSAGRRAEVPAADLTRPAHWRELARSGDLAQAMALVADQDATFVSVAVGPSADGTDNLGALTPSGDDWQALLAALGRLYVSGVRVDWAGFDRDFPRSRLVLPTYPFQRQRYWPEPAEACAPGRAAPRAVLTAWPTRCSAGGSLRLCARSSSNRSWATVPPRSWAITVSPVRWSCRSPVIWKWRWRLARCWARDSARSRILPPTNRWYCRSARSRSCRRLSRRLAMDERCFRYFGRKRTTHGGGSPTARCARPRRPCTPMQIGRPFAAVAVGRWR